MTPSKCCFNTFRFFVGPATVHFVDGLSKAAEFQYLSVFRGSRNGRETWLVAREIEIYDDGEPGVLFQIKHTNEYVKFFGEDLAELAEDGVLKGKQEVNNEIEKALGLS